MGWINSHLRQFVINKTCYSQPDFDLYEIGDLAVKNEGDSIMRRFRFRSKDSFVCEYDFGDGWRHVITVEKALERTAGRSYPQVAGKRACPPEDVGGIRAMPKSRDSR